VTTRNKKARRLDPPRSRGRDDIEARLEIAGFRLDESGCYRQNGTAVHLGRHWLRMEREHVGDRDREDEVGGMLGQCGPWRPVGGDGGSTRTLVADLPRSMWTSAADAGSEAAADLGGRCVEWGLATSGGGAPEGWAPPSPERAADLVPPGAGTIVVGDIVRDCVVYRDEGRLAIECPLVPFVPADLAATRQCWLERLLAEARALWRMARVGLRGGALVAEVDLTGVPHDALAGAVPAALHALHGLVAWTARPALVIASDLPSAALEARAAWMEI